MVELGPEGQLLGDRFLACDEGTPPGSGKGTMSINDTSTPLPAVSSAPEATPLAQELARVYQTLMRHYRDQCGLPTEDAHVRATAPAQEATQEQLLKKAACEFSWTDLHLLASRDPKLAAREWTRIKLAARDELTSGHRAARVFEDTITGSPWERAQFLAVREELREQWQPKGGMEAMLIDQMAQSYTLHLRALQALTVLTLEEYVPEEKEKRRRRELPRLSQAQALEQASAMADRWNRMFLRTLRALRDMRRYAPIIVQNAGQVNVASEGGQQVNVVQPQAEGENEAGNAK